MRFSDAYPSEYAADASPSSASASAPASASASATWKVVAQHPCPLRCAAVFVPSSSSYSSSSSSSSSSYSSKETGSASSKERGLLSTSSKERRGSVAPAPAPSLGRSLLVGSNNRGVCLYPLTSSSGAVLEYPEVHRGSVYDLDVDAASCLFATASNDKNIRFGRIPNDALEVRFSCALSLLFSPFLSFHSTLPLLPPPY